MTETAQSHVSRRGNPLDRTLDGIEVRGTRVQRHIGQFLFVLDDLRLDELTPLLLHFVSPPAAVWLRRCPDTN